MGATQPGSFTPLFLRTGNNYDRDRASNETGLDCSTMPSLTQQQFKEEADINTIVRRFGLTGELPSDLAMPQTGDFTGISDFHTAMNVVRQAQEEFMRLPAETRYRFANDPGRLLQFVADAGNKDEAIKLGLVPKPPEKDIQGEPLPLTPAPKA